MKWPEFANIHPWHCEQTAGYDANTELERMLAGSPAMTLSAATELRGSGGIRRAVGEPRLSPRARRGPSQCCLIPERRNVPSGVGRTMRYGSGGGQNRRNGNVDVQDLSMKAQQHASDLAA